jgi:hypothetical protein
VRRSMSMHSRATDRGNASKCQEKWPDQTLGHRSGAPLCGWPPAARVWLPGKLENRYYSRQFGRHLGN